MTNKEELSAGQSFGERTLKYGRNLMAVAVPILVFAWVPVVDIAKSRPFNFAIEKDGEFYIWVILLAVLIYYGFRFFGLAIPDFRLWKQLHGNPAPIHQKNLVDQHKHIQAHEAALHHERQNKNQPMIKQIKQAIKEVEITIERIQSNINHYRWERLSFWIFDAGLPTVFFLIALWASVEKIYWLSSTDIPIC